MILENKNKTLYDVIFQQRNVFFDMFMIIFSVGFLALMSNIKIPLWPVPITMQTFGVFLIAFFFGSRKGFFTIFAYTLAGIVGFGVFSGWKSGITTVFGPTGGYILGFMIAVFVVGFMIENGLGRTKKSVFMCMVIGNIIIYATGIMGLKLYFAEFSHYGASNLHGIF